VIAGTESYGATLPADTLNLEPVVQNLIGLPNEESVG
jgi:hypothetical protein